APADYAELASGWLDRRVRIIGGCCGTTPDHLLALRQMLDRD
ncbi:MAG: homocysteine S-methyltransferase family protein, partial [Planctomycetaceae bacterium]